MRYKSSAHESNANFKSIKRAILNSITVPKHEINLTVISFNTHGLINSVPKMNEYISNNVLFIQEHMCTDNIIFKDSFKNNNDLKIYFNSAKKSRGRGRPSAGLAFIHPKSWKSKCVFENYRIGTLCIDNLAIIGVYMIYEDAAKPQNEITFVEDLIQVKKIYTDFYIDDYEIIILGDFNTDLRDTKSIFTLHLKNFMNELNLTSLSTLKDQPINYTFIPDRRHIDHVLANTDLIKEAVTTIMLDPDINSDHYALETTINVKPRIDIRSKTHEYINIPINKLQSYDFRKLVQLNLEPFLLETLNKLEIFYNSNDDDHLLLTNIVNDLDTKIKNVFVDIHKTSESPGCFGKRLSNTWWNDDAQKLHERRMTLVKIKQKTELDKYELKSIKKRLVAIKKKYKKNHRINMNRKLALENRLDKLKFWRTLDNTLNKRIEPNIKLDNVKSEFEKLFNEKLVCNLDKEKDAETTLKQLNLWDTQQNPRLHILVLTHTIQELHEKPLTITRICTHLILSPTIQLTNKPVQTYQ